MSSISGGSYQYSSFGGSGSYQYSSFGGSSPGDNVDNNKVDSLNTSTAEHPDIVKANKLKKTIDGFKSDGKENCFDEEINSRVKKHFLFDETYYKNMKEFDLVDLHKERLAFCIDFVLDSKYDKTKRLACEIFDKIKINSVNPDENTLSKYVTKNHSFDMPRDTILYLMIELISYHKDILGCGDPAFFVELSAEKSPYDLILNAIDKFIADKRKELANLPRTSDASSSSLSTSATSATSAAAAAAAATSATSTSATSATSAAAAAAAIISSSSPAPFADATQPSSSSSTSNDAAHKRIDKLKRKIEKREKKLAKIIEELEDLNAENAKLESELEAKH
jgi:hypothetical protein